MFIITKDTKDGLDYVENSANWKVACSLLPCSAEMWWPGYLTKVVEDKIGGFPIVIQLWKGWCERLGGRYANFPGGMGAEVGVYRRVSEDEEYSERFLFKKPVKEMERGCISSATIWPRCPRK